MKKINNNHKVIIINPVINKIIIAIYPIINLIIHNKIIITLIHGFFWLDLYFIKNMLRICLRFIGLIK